jgi:hypothetical protein
MFIKRFMGTGENAIIQRITELTKTEKGEQVLMFLVADLVEDGVIGDNEREGNEEAMQSYEQTINIDLITHSRANKGKLSEQKTVIKFREPRAIAWPTGWPTASTSWPSSRCRASATRFMNNGATRVGSPFPNLAFAADVTAPSSQARADVERHRLVASNTATITRRTYPRTR